MVTWLKWVSVEVRKWQIYIFVLFLSFFPRLSQQSQIGCLPYMVWP